MLHFSVNVRALAEFVWLRGDLMPGQQGQTARMLEGSVGHRLLQGELGAGWSVEEGVRRTENIEDATLEVHGRADAVYRGEGRLCVLEIKTTVQNPNTISMNDYPAHLAQGQIYAYIICAGEGYDEAEVRLCYYRMDGGRRTHRAVYSLQELRTAFLNCAVPYVQWNRLIAEWKETSAPTLKTMRFPYAEVRPGQRDMAAQVYYAFRDGGSAIIEAPTGIGKTAAALYGALKALGKGSVTAVFYLTARTTGRRAAEQALDLMRASGLRVRSVVITAKEKCCLLGDKQCFGCPYAQGYYEKRMDALRSAMELERFDAALLEHLAREYEVCPYELSLDISEQSDVVICDYNYVFNPRVRLKRYFETKSKVGLLIDEAHNLPDRAQDMFSAELSGKRVAETIEIVERYEGAESPTALALRQLLASLGTAPDEPETQTALSEEWLQDIRVIGDTLLEIGPVEPQAQELMMDAVWFTRAVKLMDEEHYRIVIAPEGGYRTVRVWCFDPSAHLGKAFSRVGGTALFSATIAPMAHYAALLGLGGEEGATQLQLPSPFPRENLFAARVPVAVTYQERERTLEAVTRILHAMASAHAGNYVACFPSFAYMQKVAARYHMLFPEDRLLRQKSAMSESERARFIEEFKDRPKKSMLAFIVLGGVFAEGIDLPGERLSGAAIVTTGMPQLGFERDQLAMLMDDGFGSGYASAYVYPGIRRVLQAAGRVIRTETDKGVVLLIDKRYDAEDIRDLLPTYWNVRRISKMEKLEGALDKFWKGFS